jgi:glycosyltransferase involved in cell wall biosynthesis
MSSGGMEGRVARLARGLDPEIFQVSVMTLKPPSGRQVELPSYVPQLLHEIRSGIHPTSLASLSRVIRQGRYDVVHTHNWSSMFYGLLGGWFGGVRVLFHGEHGLDEVGAIPFKRLFAQKSLARLVTRVVSVNASIARNVRQNWSVPQGRIVVLPNGVDLERFRPAPQEPEVFTLGTVGRHDSVKNFPLLIDAFVQLRQRLAPAEVRLIFVGQGGLTDDLKAQCAHAGVSGLVTFVGDTTHPEEWYGRFSAYVNCSIYEGMSNTVLEAMACGLPVVVSDVQGHRDWIREGENALFAKKEDASAFADAFETLYRDSDLRKGMGERNRIRVEQEFDNCDFIRNYADLYRKCLGVSGAKSSVMSARA